MADEQPPEAKGKAPELQHSGKVIPLEKALLRKRVLEAMVGALERWPAVATVDATEQMIELDINTSQIIYGMRRAEIMEFSEDIANGRMLFTAKLLSAGEEFFVSAAVERLVPFAGSHVVIRRVWR